MYEGRVGTEARFFLLIYSHVIEAEPPPQAAAVAAAAAAVAVKKE